MSDIDIDIDKLISAARQAFYDLSTAVEELATTVDPTGDPAPPPLTAEQRGEIADFILDVNEVSFGGFIATLDEVSGSGS